MEVFMGAKGVMGCGGRGVIHSKVFYISMFVVSVMIGMKYE